MSACSWMIHVFVFSQIFVLIIISFFFFVLRVLGSPVWKACIGRYSDVIVPFSFCKKGSSWCDLALAQLVGKDFN